MIKRLWDWLFHSGQDRRKGERMSAENLSAYYWNGTRAEKRKVRDISPSGLYVVTEDRWYPGTVVRMTVQKDGADGQGAVEHMAIDSKAVRFGEDGVGMAFVTSAHERSASTDGLVNEVRDRRGVEQFLRRLLKKRG